MDKKTRDKIRKNTIKEIIYLSKETKAELKEDDISILTDEDLKILLVEYTNSFKPETMKLHERRWYKDVAKDVVRVSSGWIYSDWNHEIDQPMNSVFVPFKQPII